MHVKELMTTNVITVSSNTSIADARKFMVTHNILRLPVVDKGKLVGIVSKRRIAEASPSPATSLSIWELNYLLAKMTVKEIMAKDVITISPDATAEAALALAQERKVGALIVVDEGHLVGIVTTNDYVYRILNPLLGLGKPGVRLHVYDCGTTPKIEEIVRFINKHDLTIEALHVDDSPERGTRDLIVQVNADDPAKLIEDLTTRGYRVEIRER
ncbi:CBS domain-containing protein [Dehalococcoidia bacterium]|nr:CBS domain-containing protein [Dehalococcoidia bacterium]MCL0074011.1 CBS domain-containing protein [Dehalococcoidia bacterium]MCL0088553.1 CBS domain-containing protein [Dehalococcoidia bacterium]